MDLQHQAVIEAHGAPSRPASARGTARHRRSGLARPCIAPEKVCCLGVADQRWRARDAHGPMRSRRRATKRRAGCAGRRGSPSRSRCPLPVSAPSAATLAWNSGRSGSTTSSGRNVGTTRPRPPGAASARATREGRARCRSWRGIRYRNDRRARGAGILAAPGTRRSGRTRASAFPAPSGSSTPNRPLERVVEPELRRRAAEQAVPRRQLPPNRLPVRGHRRRRRRGRTPRSSSGTPWL